MTTTSILLEDWNLYSSKYLHKQVIEAGKVEI